MQVTVDVRRGPSWENEEGERANRTVSVRPPVRPSIHRGEMQTQTQMQTPPGWRKRSRSLPDMKRPEHPLAVDSPSRVGPLVGWPGGFTYDSD